MGYRTRFLVYNIEILRNVCILLKETLLSHQLTENTSISILKKDKQ
jgi:hypothetical protein